MVATTRRSPEVLEAPQPLGWVAAVRERVGRLLIGWGEWLVSATATTGAKTQATGNDRFASLASMIPGVVYQRVVTADGDIRYTYISEGARELFGVEPAEVMRNPEALFSTYSDDYKANFRQRLIEASRTLTTWDVEASLIGADGQMRYTHAIAKPERLDDGSVLWTGLILDATRIKQAEERLKAANRSVEAANQAKSMFLANMSHEIRTPMNGVLGMADLLLKTDLNGRQHRLLSTLKHSAQTLLAIINDVLDISRIEAGRFNLENESFDLHRCLDDAIDLCASAAYKKGLEINLVVESDLPVIVKGDGGRLRQVLINLLGNAVKFTEVGEATLRASAAHLDEGRVLVTIDVIDTGIGIDATAKAKLFAPFAQADSSISRRFGGTGLGLAITRHLVTLMGGTVELESEVGRGTAVTVKLPLEVVARRHANDPIDPLGDQRILVVDDRQSVREAIASKLNATGAVLGFADSEEEAERQITLAKEEGAPYTGAIVDRLRPGKDGVELGQRLKQIAGAEPLKVINVVSMNWKGNAATQAILTLPKPVRKSDFLSALRGTGSDATVPVGERSGEAGGSPRDLPAQTSLGLRVLLAEDNPVNQEVAREFLNSFDCSVTVANDGHEAVAFLTDGSFDIVLMDCQMPALDGLSAVRMYRELEAGEGRRRTPIIAATANAYDSDRAEALAAGMDDYLVKPFSDRTLLAMLQKWKDRSPRRQ